MIKIYNDTPNSWQLSFQDEATPIAAGIIDFHNKTMYYLIIIFSIVTYIIFAILFSNRSINRLSLLKHSTIIELI